jgi:hypothetical protein
MNNEYGIKSKIETLGKKGKREKRERTYII